MLSRWGSFVARRPRLVLRSTLAGLFVFALLSPVFLARLLGIAYDTAGSESYRATQAIEERLGAQEAVLVVVSAGSRGPGDPALGRVLDEAVRIAGATDGVAAIPPVEVGGATSGDGLVAYRTVLLSGNAGDRQDTAAALMHDLEGLDVEALDAAGVEVGVTGRARSSSTCCTPRRRVCCSPRRSGCRWHCWCCS